jgi:hypothetical protein
MSFFRHGEIYHYDEGATPQDHALAHRNDEFPAGYSSAGCSPAVPASASPASAIILSFTANAKTFAANGKLSLISLSQLRGAVGDLSRIPKSRFEIVRKIGFRRADSGSGDSMPMQLRQG